jgi:hypothetical protein
VFQPPLETYYETMIHELIVSESVDIPHILGPPQADHSRGSIPHFTMLHNRRDSSPYPVGAIALSLMGELAHDCGGFLVVTFVKSVQSCLEELGLSKQAG